MNISMKDIVFINKVTSTHARQLITYMVISMVNSMFLIIPMPRFIENFIISLNDAK
jgi:hypothetical protein